MKTEITLRFPLPLLRMKGQMIAHSEKNSGKKKRSLLVGVQTDTAAMEINVEVPLETPNLTTSRSSYIPETLHLPTEALNLLCSLLLYF